jgi:hypothetical protein
MPKAKRTEGSIHLILKYLPNTTENFIVQGLSQEYTEILSNKHIGPPSLLSEC